MIVAQERDIKFSVDTEEGRWWPDCPQDNYPIEIFEEMREALQLRKEQFGEVRAYLSLLNEEHEAARQRFIDYVPPED